MTTSFNDLIAQDRTKQGMKCGLLYVLPKLDDATRKQVEAAMASDEIPGSKIARALTKLGHDIKGNTVQRHRQHDCSCPHDS